MRDKRIQMAHEVLNVLSPVGLHREPQQIPGAHSIFFRKTQRLSEIVRHIP